MRVQRRTNRGVAKKGDPKFRSGLERTFHRAHPVPYETVKLTYTIEHRYCPDFQLGPNLYVEAKGVWDSASRTKHLAVRKQNPLVKILFVFQNPNLKLSRRSKTSYSDWCDAKGFKWTTIEKATSVTHEKLVEFLNGNASRL